MPSGTDTRRAASVDDFLPDAKQTDGDQKILDHPVALTVGSETPAATNGRARVAIRTPEEPVLAAHAASAPLLPEAVLMPALYTRSGHLIVPPALKGSHQILVHQNTMADSEGLDRIQDDDDLRAMRAQKRLVALPSNSMIEIDPRLPANRRYCRPWTAQFLAALARAHERRFHTSLQINSAVRTVEFQVRLQRTNANAAPAEGQTASPHLTGEAVDLAKHGLSMAEIAWLRDYLLPLVKQGKVDVEEEFQQSCFHISIYRKYMPSAAGKSSGKSGQRHFIQGTPQRHATTLALASAVLR